jgi:type IV pilus assembly protein PilP
LIRKDRSQILAYALVSLLSVSGAFLISLHFVKRAKAQDSEPPPPVETPAETNAAEQPPPQPEPAAPPQAAPRQAVPSQGAVPPAGQPAAARPAQPSVPSAQPAMPAQPGVAAQPGAVPAAGINALEGFLEPFIYDIVNRRDPFQPYAEYQPSIAAAEDNGPPRALSPAQRWDLDQLKLIGIMWDIKDPKAMFLDPEEDVMILGRDESIGNRNGYVATIREGEVVVVEAIRKRGDIIYRTKVIRIER